MRIDAKEMENNMHSRETSSYTIPVTDMISSAIEEIEKKNRPDIERICAVVNERHGLVKEDTVDVITRMQREGFLTLKLYDSGPPAYKINIDFVDEKRRKSDVAIAFDRAYNTEEEIPPSSLPRAGFQPEHGVGSLLAKLDSLANCLVHTSQLLHQEGAKT